jgi:hypothetical protein
MNINKSDFTRVYNNPTLDQTSKELVQKVISFIWDFDKTVVQDFYVGVTNVPEKRLFDGHKLKHGSSKYLLLEASNEDCAVNAEKALLELDMTGGIENSKGRYLYCYFIDGWTRETKFSA